MLRIYGEIIMKMLEMYNYSKKSGGTYKHNELTTAHKKWKRRPIKSPLLISRFKNNDKV